MDAAGLLVSTAAMRWMDVTESSKADSAIEREENFMMQDNKNPPTEMSSVKRLATNYL